MVRFEKDRLTIEIVTNTNPIEYWLETLNGMITLLQCQDSEMLSNNYFVFELIREMMPDIETAKKMINDKGTGN